jgi:hypothetical protein
MAPFLPDRNSLCMTQKMALYFSPSRLPFTAIKILLTGCDE